MKHASLIRLAVPILASIAQLLMFYAWDHIHCGITECVLDDGSMRATAIFEPLVLIAFLLAYWVFVCPLFLWMGKWLSYSIAVPLSAALIALIVCFMLHNKTVDKNIFATIASLFPVFFFPWVVGAYTGRVLNSRFQEFRER